MRFRYDAKGKEIYAPSCETLSEMACREQAEIVDDKIASRPGSYQLKCCHCGRKFAVKNYFRFAVKCPKCKKSMSLESAKLQAA